MADLQICALQERSTAGWVCVVCLTGNRQSGDAAKVKMVDTLSVVGAILRE